MKCRQSNSKTEKIREFTIPPFNFDAESYFELIDWQSASITEPPLTTYISDEKLREMILVVPDVIDFLKFPCHTQAVERCIKLVTESSVAVCGGEARDGFIRARIASRKNLPIFETKTQYLKVLNTNAL